MAEPTHYEKYDRDWREKNADYWRDYNQKLRQKQRRAVLDLLGGKCVLCNRKDSETKLIVHQRFGKPHGTSYVRMLTHMEDFVVLCLPHHSMVHRLKNTERLEAMIGVCQDLLPTTLESPVNLQTRQG
jgi:hypothetical protein